MVSLKRKAEAPAAERPPKKVQTSKVKVTHLKGSKLTKPVVATAPGATVPSDLKFTSFSKKEPKGDARLALHSSDHPTIDYIANETVETEATEKNFKHYLVVFDPVANSLSVVEAKKMTVRSVVRVPHTEEEEVTNAYQAGTRAALTQAFGTKKSRKAVASMAENRLLARDNDPNDPVARAVFDSIDDSDQSDDGLVDAMTARVTKPVPFFNNSTDDITQVYELRDLVFPPDYQTTLSQMPIAFWKDCIKKNKAVPTALRFVATRVTYLTQRHLDDPTNADILQKLQLLRYIQLLVEIHKFIATQNVRKPMPAVEDWPHGTTTDSSLSTVFKRNLVAAFFPTGIPSLFQKTLLRSTILALTLLIPPPNFVAGDTPAYLFTEPTEITLDLATPQDEIHKLFRELGCKFESMTDAELRRHGWDKIMPTPQKKVNDEDGKPVRVPKPKFAKLKFPIEFPKVSAGRPGRK